MLSDGSEVRWGSAEESGLKADVLATLMSVPATTYDVSVPGLPTTTG
jgi:cell division protein FtsQ